MPDSSVRVIMRTPLLLLFLSLASASVLSAQENLLASTDRWTLSPGGAFTSEGGESVLRLTNGPAGLNDLVFENGSISFEMRLPPQRGFIGLLFRVGTQDAEHVYFRPHKSGEWDALQYQSIMNGSTTWQILSGPGFNQAVDLPADVWIPVRLDVDGTWAALFVGAMDSATMRMQLQRGVTKGGLAFSTSLPGGARPGAAASFRRLRVAPRPATASEAAHADAPADAFIRTWTVSQPIAAATLPITVIPTPAGASTTVWAEPSGLVNLNRYFSKVEGAERSAVVVGVEITADRAMRLPLAVDFSDDISLFLNAKLLFSGTNAWESRYPYYLGALNPAALTNTAWLDLRRGSNRLTLVVSDQTFGWGFIASLERTAGLRVKGR